MSSENGERPAVSGKSHTVGTQTLITRASAFRLHPAPWPGAIRAPRRTPIRL